MEKAIQVKIVSPERTLFNGQAKSILVPGEKGSFEVLYNHAPIISCLTSGIVRCVGEETLNFNIAGDGTTKIKASDFIFRKPLFAPADQKAPTGQFAWKLPDESNSIIFFIA